MSKDRSQREDSNRRKGQVYLLRAGGIGPPNPVAPPTEWQARTQRFPGLRLVRSRPFTCPLGASGSEFVARVRLQEGEGPLVELVDLLVEWGVRAVIKDHQLRVLDPVLQWLGEAR